MIFSLFYFFSQIALTGMFLLYPKNNTKLPLFLWVIPMILMPEIFACSVGGVLTAVGLPADITTIGIGNFAAAGFLYLLIRRKGSKVQQYFFDWKNGISIGILTIIALFVAYIRFTPALNISFETSDPSIHMQMAMDSLIAHSVLSPRTFMFMGNFTNSLFLRFWLPFVGNENLYRVFIVKLCLNWLVDASIFFCIIRTIFKKNSGHFVSLGISVLYFLGYPLTNLLFGFNYLGLTVTLFLFLIFIEQQRAENILPVWMAYILLSITCFSIAVGYVIFAPIAFLGVFLSLSLDYWREKRKFMDFGYIKMQLSVFLFPTLLMLLYYFVLIERLGGNNDISGLMAEGYIYRNLYSDFILVLPFSAIGLSLLVQMRNSQNNTLLSMVLFAIIETLVLVFLLLKGKISSYYYFKINFLLWPLIWILAAVAVAYLFEHLKISVYFLTIIVVAVFGMFVLQIEKRMNEHSIQVNPGPYATSETWMRNYEFNEFILQREPFDKNKTILYSQLRNELKNYPGQITFLGYWLDSYWCEAITDVRNSYLVQGTEDATDVLTKISDIGSGHCIVLQKDVENFNVYYPKIEETADEVWENDAGYIFVVQ